MATKKNDSLVNYGDFTLEDAEQQAEESAKSSSSSNMIKLTVGKTIGRILPPKKGEKPIKVAYVHYIDVPGVGRVNFNCPRLMAKGACPVCKTEADLLATGEDSDFKKSRKLKAKRRCYVNMVVRGEEDLGPRPFPFGKMIEDQLIEIRQDEDDGGNFMHPVEGFDLKFTRKGEGANDTEYKVVKTGGTKPLCDDAAQMREWIENQPSLARFLTVPDEEEIEAKLSGEETDERPTKRRKSEERKPEARKPSRAVVDEIEDGEIILED